MHPAPPRTTRPPLTSSSALPPPLHLTSLTSPHLTSLPPPFSPTPPSPIALHHSLQPQSFTLSLPALSSPPSIFRRLRCAPITTSTTTTSTTSPVSRHRLAGPHPFIHRPEHQNTLPRPSTLSNYFSSRLLARASSCQNWAPPPPGYLLPSQRPAVQAPLPHLTSPHPKRASIDREVLASLFTTSLRPCTTPPRPKLHAPSRA